FLAFFSIIGDWMMVYNQYDPELASTSIRPLLNIHFLTSLLLIASFSFIAYLNRNRHEPLPGLQAATPKSFMQLAIPTILLCTIYFALRIEITTYWDQLYRDSSYVNIVEGTDYPTTYYNENLPWFKEIWALNYSILFFSLLAFINWRFIRNKRLARVVIGFGFICIVAFLSQGLLVLNELRDSYLYLDASSHYVAGSFNMTIRYITYAFAGLMLFVLYRTIHKEDLDAQKRKLIIAFDLLFHVSLVIVLSNEWITWMSFLQYSESTRLGLSILWGMYALLLIILGIWKNKRHLRIGAIVLFAVTLVKLALYDISHLDTIAKTIIFVSLGILLLVISFLYNKYKHLTHPE
ncbi:MAG: DUF2339 domain-containing protein, partial [Saprospiraceae bacterium]|nr:DUF2339 domain-containing protein [Saprospiraceae bacterium]